MCGTARGGGADGGEAGRQKEWGVVDYLAFVKTFKQKKRRHGRVLQRGVAQSDFYF